MYKTPSQKLHNLLSGRTEWDDADEAIRSWASFEIYKAAEDVLRLPTKEKRREFLDRVPASLRPHIEEEVMRLWSLTSR